jgi:hypothetical protein
MKSYGVTEFLENNEENKYYQYFDEVNNFISRILKYTLNVDLLKRTSRCFWKIGNVNIQVGNRYINFIHTEENITVKVNASDLKSLSIQESIETLIINGCIGINY